jgi:hypothetical protein
LVFNFLASYTLFSRVRIFQQIKYHSCCLQAYKLLNRNLLLAEFLAWSEVECDSRSTGTTTSILFLWPMWQLLAPSSPWMWRAPTRIIGYPWRATGVRIGTLLLSFRVTNTDGQTLEFTNVVPKGWKFGQTFASKLQFKWKGPCGISCDYWLISGGTISTWSKSCLCQYRKWITVLVLCGFLLPIQQLWPMVCMSHSFHCTYIQYNV